MLFFKKKSEEILPPPPPFPSMELEEEKEKPVLFDEIIKPEKVKALPEEKEFEDLLKEFKEEKPKKTKEKKAVIKKPKVLKKEVKKAKIIPIKKIQPKQIKKITPIKVKEKPIPQKIKPIKLKEKPLKKLKTGKPAKIKEAELPELEEEFKELGFKLPKEFEPEKEIKLPEELEEKELELPEIEKSKEIELPETLEDIDIEGVGKELGVEKEFGGLEEAKQKPKEIIEAEEEIKSAIEKIKEQEKPSLFKRLFGKKEKVEEREEHLFPEVPETDEISVIKNSLNKAREALMKFDLETAKKNYIEVMKLYNKIKPEEQAKVYHDIRDLYFERKSAEELKV